MLALLSAAWLAACARSVDTARETLTFWTFGREGEAIGQLLGPFRKAHPQLRVVVQQLPLSAAHQKLLTAFAGGAAPDMAQLGNTWLPELATLHALAPLDARVAGSQAIDRADYFPRVWATNMLDGTLYGIPWYVDTRLLFYRRDLLARAGFGHPPADWAQWRTMLAALSRPAARRYAILLPTNEYEQLLSLALQQGEPLLRDGDRYGNFCSAGFRHALGFYLDTFRRGQAPAVSNVEAGNPWAEFGRGTYAFYLSGPWNIGEFRARLPASQQRSWATAPLPAPHGSGVGLAGGGSLVIFRGSHHADAAWALVEYLSRPDVQQRLYDLLGDMPPRRSAWAGGALRDDVQSRAFRQQFERVVGTPQVPEWERIANEMQQVAAQAVDGRYDVDGACAELNRRVDTILAKRRWVMDYARSGASLR